MPTSGVAALDRMLSGGYPEKSAILVEGPPGNEKEVLSYKFLRSGLGEGHFCVYITRLPPEEIIQDARACGVDFASRNPLWMSPEGGNRDYSPSDLAAVSFGVKEILKGHQGTKTRIAFDGLSQLLALHSAESVYKFLGQLLTEAKRQDSVILATVQEGMHQPQVISSMELLFDGVLAIRRNDLGGLEVTIKKMRGLDLSSSSIVLNVPREGDSKVVMPWEKGGATEAPQLDSKRIAVLPFTNMSPDPADEYFADGMTEELISTVSKIEGIEVISRTSVMQYKKTPKPIRDLSQELAVGIVLEGSVRKARNKLRVGVQMIDATRDRHLWAETYDRNFQDIFAIQVDIANRVAEVMKGRISEIGSRAMSSQSTSNLEAYALYLRATQLFHEGNESALKEAISIFERAISRDPDFVRAYAGLARTWGRVVGRGYEDFAPGVRKAEAAALRAVELGPDAAEAHAAMSEVHLFMDRYKESISEAENAIKIDPNLSEAYLSLGTCYATIGALDQALLNFQRACELDPLSFRAKTVLAEAYRIGHREGEALDALEKLKELNPRNPQTYITMADCYIQKRDFTKAQEMLSDGLRFSPDEPYLKIGQGFLYALTGRTREAEGELEVILRDKRESVRLRGQIVIQMGLGNLDEAFAALMRGAETHSWYDRIKSDPLYERLQKDARFPQFCLKVGLPA